MRFQVLQSIHKTDEIITVTSSLTSDINALLELTSVMVSLNGALR